MFRGAVNLVVVVSVCDGSVDADGAVLLVVDSADLKSVLVAADEAGLLPVRVEKRGYLVRMSGGAVCGPVRKVGKVDQDKYQSAVCVFANLSMRVMRCV